jgi:hypothetical protein
MDNIHEFLSRFPAAFQRANRYTCQILLNPAGLWQNILKTAALDNSSLAMPQVIQWMSEGWLVESTRMPDRGFAQTDLSMYGITEHFPYHAEFSPLECSFMVPIALADHSLSIIRFFSAWQNQIQHAQAGPDSGFDFNFPADYYATVLLTLLDDQNAGTCVYKFHNVYPVTVQTQPVAWATLDQFISLPVQFNYSYWTLQPT